MSEASVKISSQRSDLGGERKVLVLLLDSESLVISDHSLMLNPGSSPRFFPLKSRLLILLPVSLILSNLLFEIFSCIFRLPEPSLENLNLLMQVISDTGLVVQRIASGLKSLNLDILVLSGNGLAVKFLDNLDLRNVGVVDHARLLWRDGGRGSCFLWRTKRRSGFLWGLHFKDC